MEVAMEKAIETTFKLLGFLMEKKQTLTEKRDVANKNVGVMVYLFDLMS